MVLRYSGTMAIIHRNNIDSAFQYIKPFVQRTPLIYSAKLSERLGAKVYLKCENLQETGSFKIRGAANKLGRLTDDQKKRGIVACSAGNHAQGVASQAQRLGIPATICMPKIAPLVKIMNTRKFGADVRLIGTKLDEAFDEAHRLEKENGLTFIHPFADPYIMAGQGTVALEIFQEIKPDWIFVPVGGGGLAGGISVYAKDISPQTKVIGVQSDRAPAVFKSFKSGQLTYAPVSTTLADGLAVKSVDQAVVDLLREKLDDMMVVSEDEVIHAMGMYLEESKLLVEGAGSVALASALRMHEQIEGSTVVLVVSGGNVDLSVMERVVDRTLHNYGRLSWFTIEVPDRPGSLKKIASVVADEGANVLQVSQERSSGKALPFGVTEVQIEIETSGFDHVERISQKLSTHGFTVRRGS